MIKPQQVPQHIAIIMDGNGRWARQRKLPRVAGHQQGAEVVKSVVGYCSNLGVKFLTLYTFSTENWKRPREEISFLMNLLGFYLENEIQNLKRNKIRFLSIGKTGQLPQKAREIISRAVELTKENTGLTLILALNYGGRAEIIDAVSALCRDVKEGIFAPDAVSEEVFSRYLYTAGIPDPELLIRTSGEMRLSNFLLWQISYSELYVTDTLWPDFSEAEFQKAITSFQNRNRRFGGISVS
ncbi:MAG: isoprenyl transferase [Candidatus Omnitrophica bacterium]|nr:isoprenyl transferase [Candidatus Omnitrophota bacterium]MBU4479662.1 isoprenyl transferase [Candidatus Omnitrophota bacterium]MCG2703658.1 isoprenyl transferase [Candidatus Omnitrophota bacterium]